MQDRIRDHIRSNVWGLVAVFIALSGTAYATHPGGENTISSGDVINGEVRNADIGENAVGSGKINDGAVRSPDIRDGAAQTPDIDANAVTNPKLASRSVGFLELQFDSVHTSNVMDDTLQSRDIADDSLTGADVANDSLGGADVDESTLSVEAMGCQIGVIHGFARITNTSLITAHFTTSGRIIDRAYNCAGGPIAVKSSGKGVYTMRFADNPSTLPFTTSTPASPAARDNFVTAMLGNSACAGEFKDPTGVYCIWVTDNDGDLQDGPFQILLP